VAKPLLAALDSAGVRAWRDEKELRENAPVMAEIRTAIARSKTLIALYSADYPLSYECFEELSTAWIAAQQAGELPYSRVLVLSPEPGSIIFRRCSGSSHRCAGPRMLLVSWRLPLEPVRTRTRSREPCTRRKRPFPRTSPCNVDRRRRQTRARGRCTPARHRTPLCLDSIRGTPAERGAIYTFNARKWKFRL
jgi:hypothetical protein